MGSSDIHGHFAGRERLDNMAMRRSRTGDVAQQQGRVTKYNKNRKAQIPKKYLTAMRRVAYSTLSAQQEIKFHMHTEVGVGVDLGGVLWNCTAISQGDTDETRDGDSIYLKKWTINFGWTAGDGNNLVRVIAFQWKENDTFHVPLPTDVLQIVGSPISPLSTYLHDKEQGKNFGVLYDETFALAVNAATESMEKSIDVSLQYARRKIQYNAGSVGGSNKLYVLAISDSGAVPNPQLKFVSRVLYTDC